MLKKILMVVGVVFVLVGLLGFFTNPVLGLFEVNTLHNIIHLASGILAVWAAMKSEDAARMYSKVFGVIYLLVALLGWATPSFIEGLIGGGSADNVLHLILGLLFVWLGFGMKEKMPMSSNNMQM